MAWLREGCKGPTVIAAKRHASHPRILDRKNKNAKFNGIVIILCELTNRRLPTRDRTTSILLKTKVDAEVERIE
jgi:hypothetical protein